MTKKKVVKQKAKSKKVQQVKKPKVEPKPKRRMLIVDVDPAAALAAYDAKAEERAKIQVFPCVNCGAELTPSNRSILQDGRVIHIGCPKAKVAGAKNLEKIKPVLQGLPKHRGVKVPTEPERPRSEFGDLMVMSDVQGRTCIQVKRDIQTVTYLPLDLNGLHLSYMQVNSFDARFKPLVDYPVKKACEHFVRYAAEYGATDDVLHALKKVVIITEEQEMAAKKKMSDKVVKVDASGKTKAVKKNGGEKTRAGSEATNYLRELILKGGKSDDEIFKLVKDKFGMADDKRYYVGWYRWKLKKEGKNPPAPVGVVKGTPAKVKKLAERKAKEKAAKKPAKKK